MRARVFGVDRAKIEAQHAKGRAKLAESTPGDTKHIDDLNKKISAIHNAEAQEGGGFRVTRRLARQSEPLAKQPVL